MERQQFINKCERLYNIIVRTKLKHKDDIIIAGVISYIFKMAFPKEKLDVVSMTQNSIINVEKEIREELTQIQQDQKLI
jgi:hypothetical protein